MYNLLRCVRRLTCRVLARPDLKTPPTLWCSHCLLLLPCAARLSYALCCCFAAVAAALLLLLLLLLLQMRLVVVLCWAPWCMQSWQHPSATGIHSLNSKCPGICSMRVRMGGGATQHYYSSL
jgi:hypothetical protein